MLQGISYLDTLKVYTYLDWKTILNKIETLPAD